MIDPNDTRRNTVNEGPQRQRSLIGWLVGGAFVCAAIVMIVWGLRGNSELGMTSRPNTGDQQTTTGTAPSTPKGPPPASTGSK